MTERPKNILDTIHKPATLSHYTKMSAENCVAIYVVKRKRGRKGQTIYIVKYMQAQDGPAEFTTEELQQLLAGSKYTTNFNTAFSLAHHIHNQVTYTEYGVVVCRKYKNVIISTDVPEDPRTAMVARLPCIDPEEFLTRLEYWASEIKGALLDPAEPADALFLQLLELPELRASREYWKDKMEKAEKVLEAARKVQGKF